MSTSPTLLASKSVPFRSSRCPELLRLYKPQSAQHLVQFYEDDSFIIETVSFLTSQALASGDSSVIVATESHRRAIDDRIAALGLNLNILQISGRYRSVDAAEALAQFMVGDRPDEVKFNQFIGGVLHGAENKSEHGFVFAFGEMVALLCAANNPQAAIHLEQLWNALTARRRFSLYCAYSLSSLGAVPDADALMQICAQHNLTIPTETSL